MQINEDKKMLIESMNRLSNHISSNPKRQQDIFQSLSPSDLKKIITNLHDSNQSLRRVSALLLCELTYKNEDVKKKMAEMLSIYPSHGRICISGFSSDLSKYPKMIANCLKLIKTKIELEQQHKLCWVVNLENKTLFLEHLEFKKYSCFTFIDPLKNIFGFTLPEKNKRVPTSPMPQTVFYSPTSKQKKYFNEATSLKIATQLNQKNHKINKKSTDRSQDKKLTEVSVRQKQNRDSLLHESTKGKKLKQSGEYNYSVKDSANYMHSGNRTVRESERQRTDSQTDRLRNSFKFDVSPILRQKTSNEGHQTNRRLK